MKKLIVLLLVFGIVSAYVSGCSGGDDTAPATDASKKDPSDPDTP
jgi:hypothetical protein